MPLRPVTTYGLSLLAIDTAFDICSVALLTPLHTDCNYSTSSRKHADDVLPMIQNLLSQHQQEMKSLDLLAMIRGPGSFTGLRIGSAVVQGLAFGADLPVVSVSSLAMLARSARHQCDSNQVFLCCLHARDDEFYFAAYTDNLEQSPTALVCDTIMRPGQIKQTIANITSDDRQNEISSVTFTGSGWQHEQLGEIVSGLQAKPVAATADALLLAEIAIQEFRAGRAIDAESAAPVYLKEEMDYRTV